jgi:hypothetical protein
VQTPGTTTVPAEEDLHSAVQNSGGGGWRAAMAWGLAEFVVNYLLSVLAGKIVQEAQEAAMRQRWEQLRPAVQADLDSRGQQIALLRPKVPHDATIYATVLLDVITIQSGYGGATTEGYYGMNFVAPVTFGTEDIHGMGPFTSIDTDIRGLGGLAIHRPLRMSFPVSVPPSRLLPELAALRRGLIRLQTRLTALHGRTAGEAVALDDLAVAVQASDYTAGSAYAPRTNAERYATTRQHLSSAISVLAGPAQDSVDIRGVLGLLRVHADLVEALSSRWPAMDAA